MTARLPGIKQGVSFNAYVDYSLDGVAEVFSATQLSAQVRRANNEFLCQLTIVADPLAVAGRFLFSADETKTLGWPVGDVFFDIKRTKSGVVTVTDTVVFAVARMITA